METRPDDPLIRDFTEIDAGMLADVGGKAANLGELTRAGLPVPQGFCLTTEAYRRVAGDDPAKAREVLSAAAIPEDVRDAVLAAYGRLGVTTPVAVRSSATAEDLPFASFAGQQDTFLNVVGPDAVLDAVRRCWASLWTDRAVAYRESNGIDHGAVRLAVVVQEMVQSAVAGVLFTANPVTGRRREAVIDASPGLGEAVVSGAVNPDHFVVDTKTGEIRERVLGDKRLLIRSLPGGGTEQVEHTADGACLTDGQIRDLAALGARVEAHYGAPQDAEWAIDAEGALWLTQARPITTLFPLPDGATAEDPRVFLCFSVAQGLQRPITPIGLAGFRLMASGIADLFGRPARDRLDGPAPYREAGQRLWVDATTLVRSGPGRAIAPRALDVMEARSSVVLRGLFDDPRFSLAHPSWWPFLRQFARVAARYRLPVHVVRAVADPGSAHRRMAGIAASQRALLAVPDTATAVQRLDHCEDVLGERTVRVLPMIFPLAAAGFAMLGLAGKALGRRWEPGDLQPVLRGLPHNVTTEMDLELWHVATAIRADAESSAALRDRSARELATLFHEGALPDVAHRAVAAFLRDHGHRAVAEIDLGLPRWSDDPAHILGVLANYLRLEDPDLAPDVQFARGAVEAEQAVERLARKAGRVRGRFVRFALGRARLLVGLREMPKHHLVVALGHVRHQVGLIGAGLAAEGLLDAVDDVYFLDFKEIREALGGKDFRAEIAARHEVYDRETRRRRVPRVLLSDGTEPEAVASRGAPTGPGALVGTPASAGTVTGRARVVLDPVGAHLEPGEILVAPSTDPGWTPLFLTAGGLVVEMGGANSHGAVVAREYGIPAVVGVAEAVDRITTGQLITVDGALGTVVPA
ncbi:PEP/pyruvate-binding domain-containing protein [Umezawaea sp. Da 62-37]|uniref:PEP/pyruvate-binding domain-containing protein n=1 Tax=Umezawaea sp. Da 62-37 TaxID=3075927 RepID=UPI0028F6E74D|nr:PEP/pyruvate-binding domain-containing protein [Umezawaea sp. Da 62-37]WNV83626.1 PEP/pyruvate-binding domain-containing protein [Umezawaea sp. Da 62-37]